jgi:5-methylcytosine-specific restriction endonuclease McrA
MSWADMSTSKVCPKCYHRYEGYYGFIECLKEDFGDEYDIIGEWNGSQNKSTFIHNKCGTIFKQKPNAFMQGHRCNNILCCRARGENHYRWNPDLTDDERHKDRKSKFEYREFKKNVLKRDNYTCQYCGHRRDLVVHHIDGYNWSKEKRTDLSNGITLCESCHKHFHNKYGYGDNTEKQWNEFKMKHD